VAAGALAVKFETAQPAEFRFDDFFHSLIRVCFGFPASARTGYVVAGDIRTSNFRSPWLAASSRRLVSPKRFAKAVALGRGGSAKAGQLSTRRNAIIL